MLDGSLSPQDSRNYSQQAMGKILAKVMCQRSSQAPGNKTKHPATVSHRLEMAVENCGLCTNT